VATPGDAQVILQYSPSTVALAAFLEIQGPPNGQAGNFQSGNPLNPLITGPSATQTFGGGGSAPIPNVQQLLAPTAPASDWHAIGAKAIPTVVARGHTTTKKHKHHKVKKHHKSH
jgi:hypothetical protein